MEKIASFQMNHDTLRPGIYISRIDFGDIVTYDLRFKYPNRGDYLAMKGAHTIEHLFATYIRSSEIGGQVVYFGPMGCMTGFYLLLKGVPYKKAILEIQKAVQWIADFEGEIPGAKKIECGNYLAHDLADAKKEARAFAKEIAGWTEENLSYPQ